jgi:ATP-dependent Clp protease ATP-binding subunit ClpC
MTTPLTLRLASLLLSRRMASGACLVSPVAAPRAVACGPEWQAADDVRLYLTELLSRVGPEEVARHALPDGVTLTAVRVRLPREELPRRVRVGVDIEMHCIVVPDGLDRWVHVVALDHTIHLQKEEDLEAVVRAEVERLVGALEIPPDAWLRLLPPRSVMLLPATLEVERTERLPPGRVVSLRKLWAQQRQRREAEAVLRSVARPIHTLTTKLPPLVGREAPLRQLSALLDGRERISVLLQGPSMAGRSALVLHWLRARAQRDPTVQVYATSAAQLLAGMSGLGAWEARLRQVMEAAEHLDAVLWFDAMGDLFADRASGSVDIPAALKPWLDDGRVRIVGELRGELLDLAERRHGAFLACFSRLTVEALDDARTAEALRARVAFDRAHHADAGPTLRDDAVAAVVDLAARYLPYQAFPGKAFALYETLRTLHAHRPGAATGDAPDALDPDAVYDGFSLQSGIPAFLLRTRTPLDLDDVVARLAARVIGQSEAVRRVAEVVTVIKAQLQPQGRPLATLLFVGPTGVGKTELARALAALLFGGPSRMVRFDMSEYHDGEAADRLIRGTDGAEGLLTRRVREQPFGVLLLDEVEKAHPAVFDLLLQVLGEGRLTDGRGRTAYFHNTIVIMTSNLGVASHRDAAGFSAASDDAARHYQREVSRTFRPEFVNRLDRIVAFAPLTRPEVSRVAALAVGRIASRRRFARDSATLQVSDAARQRLATDGYSARYGARALRRHLEDRLVSPIAAALSAMGQERGGLVSVEVTTTEEAPASSQPGRVSRPFEAAGLRGVAVFAAGGDAGRSEAAVDRLSGGRRRVDACMALAGVEALREEIDYLRAQLDYGDREGRDGEDRRTAAELRALQVEHHRLDAVWQTLDKAREEVNVLEDVGLMAALEGAPAVDLADELDAVLVRFDRALCHSLLARERRRDAVTLRLADLDGVPGLHRWLLPLLEQAPARGWEVLVHFDGEAVAEGERWPTGHRWGPPVAHDLVVATLGRKGRDPAAVLVRVRGPWAGALLALEQGLHKHHAEGMELRFDVRRLGLCWDIPEKAWDHKAVVPEGPQALDLRGREGVVRTVTSGDHPSVRVRKGDRIALSMDAYFAELEQVALRELVPFETHEDDRDRDGLFVGPIDLGFAEGAAG